MSHIHIHIPDGRSYELEWHDLVYWKLKHLEAQAVATDETVIFWTEM